MPAADGAATLTADAGGVSARRRPCYGDGVGVLLLHTKKTVTMATIQVTLLQAAADPLSGVKRVVQS